MSIDVRPFDGLGHFKIDWLNAKHHFSFGHYHDPGRMGLGPLRVWNDDTIKPHTGFDPHPHRDMEIVTYVRSGAITHRDNLGNEGRTVAGDIQVMSAGTGIVHGEYNLEDEDTQIFQIWIIPKSRGNAPRWETRTFPRGDAAGTLVPMASGQSGIEGAVEIDQDATLYAGTFQAGHRITHPLGTDRGAYLVPARGRIRLNGVEIGARDGVSVENVEALDIEITDDAELILVDVPMAEAA